MSAEFLIPSLMALVGAVLLIMVLQDLGILSEFRTAFKREEKREEKLVPTGRFIDWKDRGWGHNYIVEGRHKDGSVSMYGWHHDLRVGDTLILHGLQWESDARAGKKSADPAKYLVERVVYKSDPKDMFTASIREIIE